MKRNFPSHTRICFFFAKSWRSWKMDATFFFVFPFFTGPLSTYEFDHNNSASIFRINHWPTQSTNKCTHTVRKRKKTEKLNEEMCFGGIHVKSLEFELGGKGFQTFLLGEKAAPSIDCSCLSWNRSCIMVKIWYPINNFANVGRPMVEIHRHQYTACFWCPWLWFPKCLDAFYSRRKMNCFLSSSLQCVFRKRKNHDKMFILTLYSNRLKRRGVRTDEIQSDVV